MSIIYSCLGKINNLALQAGQVAVLAVIALGCALDKLEEVSEVFPFRGLKLGKLDAHTEGGTAFGDDPGENQPFNPDLSVRQPKPNFHVDAGRHGCGGLHEAPADAGVG